MNKSSSNLANLANLALGAGAALLLASAVSAQSKLKRALVYSGNQWKHESIPDVENFVKKLATEKGFTADISPATAFTAANLANYQVVVLNNNVGLGGTLNTAQRDALQAWYEAGGGLVGFHANMDHRSQWEWYNDVSGTLFTGHSNIEAATLHVPVEAMAHPIGGWIMQGFGLTLTIGGRNYPNASRQYDEWYNYRNTMVGVPGTTVLLKTIHASYQCQCNTDAENHQAAWIRVYKNGRQFNTTLGGETERNGASFFLNPSKEMIWRAFQWTAGDVPTTLAWRGDRSRLGKDGRIAGSPGSEREGLRDIAGRAIGVSGLGPILGVPGVLKVDKDRKLRLVER